MKHKRFFLSAVVSVGLLSVSICGICAEAPTTAKIAYSSWRDGNMDIFLMNPNGSEEVRLTHHRAADADPRWSPTGEHIIFSSNRDKRVGDWDLYLMDADGSNVRRVFGKAAPRRNAVWFPDGKQIVYNYGAIGNSAIYIGTIDGKKEERVAIGYTPTLSPDGAEMVFLTGALNRPRRITVLNLKTESQRFLPFPKIPMWVRHPAWSPEGDRLAFAWHNRVEFQREDFKLETIYIVNRDGTGLEQVIEEGKRAVAPEWSPRGDALIYSQLDKNNMQQIFKVTLDGGEPVQLTNPNFRNFVGDWFDPTFALPVAPKPHLLTTMWGQVKSK